MKKEDKQRILIDLWKEYLKYKEKNITSGFIQRGLFLGAVIGFLFSIGILTREIFLDYWVLVIGIFAYVLHINNLDNRHFKEIYKEFLKHVKEGKIEDFKFKKLSWFENWIYYRRK